MSRIRLTKIAAITFELDKIAEEVQELDPVAALSLDRISDKLEGWPESSEGQKEAVFGPKKLKQGPAQNPPPQKKKILKAVATPKEIGTVPASEVTRVVIEAMKSDKSVIVKILSEFMDGIITKSSSIGELTEENSGWVRLSSLKACEELYYKRTTHYLERRALAKELASMKSNELKFISDDLNNLYKNAGWSKADFKVSTTDVEYSGESLWYILFDLKGTILEK